MRSYQNMNAFPEGHVINMFTDIMGAGGYMNEPKCPAGGDYDHIGLIPAQGTLVMWCSLAGTEKHEPASFGDW